SPPRVCGRGHRVYEPHPEAITLEVRAKGKTLTLYFSADPETARLHLRSKKPLNPPTPPPFCQLLRAHLEGARLERIEQVGDDRIVRLDMQRDGKPVTLMAELTGRTANLFLLDEAGIVRGQLRKGRLKHGETYAAPVAKSQAPGEAGKIRTDTQATEEFSISDELERRYQERDEARAKARQLDAIKAVLRKTLKRAVKRIEALEADLAKAERYRDYNRYGELLKSHLREIGKGAASVTVPDYFDPALPEIVLPLDPAKSPQGNLDDYFRKYKKYQNAQKAIRPRLQAAQSEAATLRERLSVLYRGEGVPADLEIPAPLRREQPVRPPRKEKSQAKPFLRFASEAGDAILV